MPSTFPAPNFVYIVDGGSPDGGLSCTNLGVTWGPNLDITTDSGAADSICSSTYVEAAGCRCCSGSESSLSGHSMCPDSNGASVICALHTYSECEALCAGSEVDTRGAANPGDRRLCTQAEIGIAAGTGCYYDYQHVWTSTTCDCAGGECGSVPTTGTDASAMGDPHLQNIHGERFDLMKPSKVVLIQVPRGQPVENALLTVEADARRLGLQCADIYFQSLNVTGAWADKVRAGGLTFTAGGARDETLQIPGWTRFGPLQLKVVHGRTSQGTEYLNFYVKHLREAGADVGGLLGEDDYTEAARPEEGCQKSISLKKKATSNSDVGHTEAIASLA